MAQAEFAIIPDDGHVSQLRLADPITVMTLGDHSGMTEEEQAAIEEAKMQEAVKLVQALRVRVDAFDLNPTCVLLARLILAVESK